MWKPFQVERVVGGETGEKNSRWVELGIAKAGETRLGRGLPDLHKKDFYTKEPKLYLKAGGNPRRCFSGVGEAM